MKLSHWKPRLIAKMRAENIQGFNSSELHRVFDGCVSPRKCLEAASVLIITGEITMKEVQS